MPQVIEEFWCLFSPHQCCVVHRVEQTMAPLHLLAKKMLKKEVEERE
jgi:hypothetical protein